MGRWSDLPNWEWRGPTPNQSGAMLEQRGLVVHIAEGTYEGTISWCRNPASQVSAHFIVSLTGKIAQMIDTDITAWTQRAGNGHWLSVENAGHTPSPLTDAQIEANAQILAKGHLVYGYPLQLATDPDGKGLGHHSMGCNWPAGTWGHCDCPGPAIIAQKPAILARAIQITGEDDPFMALSDKDQQALIWRVHAMITNLPAVAGGPTKGEVNELNAELARIRALAEAGTGSADTAAILAGVEEQLKVLQAEMRDAIADLGEGGAAQVRADAD